jgi:Protein of unknown function (DUF3604)
MRRFGMLVSVLSAAHAFAQAGGGGPSAIAVNPEREAFFGDLHLHTAFSFDAIASGTQTTPEDAYRYALGEPVEYLGRTVRRNKRLDFLAVTDHSEYLAVPYDAENPEGPFRGTQWAAEVAAAEGDTLAYMRLFSPSAFRGTAPPIAELRSDAIVTSNWQREIAAAERYNRPGRFTTLVAYEWSPMPGGAHLHRNVIFRGPAYPERPFSSLDSQRPEDLWSYVEGLRARGIDSVLIPHNSNMSQGLMFATTDSAGDPITREYAARRIANERLVEIAQNKGTSETRPEFGAPDEFADFELLTLPAEADADPAGGYVREALARGLQIEAAIGLNPFRFGLIGSSDFHSGVSASEEDNFTGALGRSDDMQRPAEVLTDVNPIAGAPATVFSAGAITGVWAENNTREAIFAALKRREAFATSGTRIRVRLFAGAGYADDLLDRSDWVGEAYAMGSPMGADLPRASPGRGPLKLVVQATRDPDGANLDRIQIVKIWRENGEAHEAVFDVAWSGSRAPDAVTGRLPPVGNSVDLEAATYTNAIGAAQLGAVWTDVDFDPAVPAIYYARVLEIPTPRWSTYLAVRNGLPLPSGVALTLQERAWTSPVFYAP